jgi:hypothetical protein
MKMRFDMTSPIAASKLAAACVLLAIAGCASFAPRTPEEQVKVRAQARQDALLKGDRKRAYEYFSPAFRATVSADTYIGGVGNAAQTVGATVESVSCETLEKCVAQVKLDIKPVAIRGFASTIVTTYANETWLLEGGQWWLFQTL